MNPIAHLRNTRTKNRRQKNGVDYGAGFWSMCHGYKRLKSAACGELDFEMF